MKGAKPMLIPRLSESAKDMTLADLPAVGRELPSLLHAVGFQADWVAAALNATDEMDLLSQSVRYAMLTEHLADQLLRTPAGVLTQLFVRNGSVPEDVYRDRLPEDLRRALDELAIVGIRDARVVGQVSVTPFSSLYLLSDQLFMIDEFGDLNLVTRPDLVMPPHASTLTLLEHVRVDDAAGGALIDVGSGCGILGLSLADGYESVTAVDVNPRAVEFSRLNAHINGLGVRALVADVTSGDLPVPAGSLLVFNAPTTIPYREDVDELGLMTARQALTSVVSALPVEGKCRARVFAVVEVPHACPSVSDLVEQWLADIPISRLDVREVLDSAARVPAGAISQGRIDPRCLLLRNGGDMPLLARYLRARGVREVVPVVVSVWI